MQTKSNIHLRYLCFTAMLVAIALVMRVFSLTIPLMGENGMRIGFAGIFSSLPAILFGPMWGGLASGVTDILGHIMRPEGAYLPQITLVAISAGFLRGIMWLLLRKRNPNRLQLVVLIGSTIILLFGIANWVIFRIDNITPNFFEYLYNQDADTSNMFFISRWAVARSEVVSNPTNTLTTMITSVTITPFVAGILGLVLFSVDKIMSFSLKKEYKEYVSIMPLLISLLVAAWWQSTLNTIILRQYVFASWQLLPFWMVWFPRIIQSTISVVVHSYFVALLMGVCKKQKYLKPYLR